jgi:hypothetical protein
MPRHSESIHDVVAAAVERVTSRLIPAIRRAISDAEAAAAARASRGARRRAPAQRRRSRQEITRWVANNRARRVPTFVIELTGLDTKKKIVAKYGPGAAFERGKAAPHVPAAHHPGTTAAHVVRARPPIVRKVAAR